MALDIESRRLIQGSLGVSPLYSMSPTAAREVELGAQWGNSDLNISTRTLQIPRDDGRQLTIRVFTPRSQRRDIIVYFHGGGWVLGSLDEYEPMSRELSHHSECTVVLVDYRLAPESKYPAAVEDCWTATTWVSNHLTELANAGSRIIVAGDSAGGNLAAVIAQRAAKTRDIHVARQVLIYPITDCDLSRPSYGAKENQLLLTRELMSWFWDQYEPEQSKRENASLAPLRAVPARGLAPAIVVSCTFDVLLDEIREFVAKLRSAGIHVAHEHYEDQMHGFFTLVNVLPGALQAIGFISDQLRSD